MGLGLGGQGEASAGGATTASGLSHFCPAAAPLGFPAWLPPHHPGLAPEPLTSAHGPEVQLNLGRVLGLAWSSWSRASRSGVFQTGQQHLGREAAAPANLLFDATFGQCLGPRCDSQEPWPVADRPLQGPLLGLAHLRSSPGLLPPGTQ